MYVLYSVLISYNGIHIHAFYLIQTWVNVGYKHSHWLEFLWIRPKKPKLYGNSRTQKIFQKFIPKKRTKVIIANYLIKPQFGNVHATKSSFFLL